MEAADYEAMANDLESQEDAAFYQQFCGDIKMNRGDVYLINFDPAIGQEIQNSSCSDCE